MAVFHHCCLIPWISSASTGRKWHRFNRRLHLWRIVEPQRVLAKPHYEVTMRCEFDFAQPRRQWLRPFPDDNDAFSSICVGLGVFSEAELRLTRADQFDIDLGQNLGVEQCSVFGSVRFIVAVPRT